jgi:hypothetical protein
MFNVKKSSAPVNNFIYTDQFIVDLVKADFFNKCYLCEEKTPRHLEIDHFYPKGYFLHLENVWTNLLCICEKCNKIRPKNINTSIKNQVLDCCIADVENLILLKFNTSVSSISFKGKGQDSIVKNTIQLLQRIHNGIGTTSNSYIDLRRLIANELAALEEEIANYETYTLGKVFKERIRKRVSRQCAFFAVKKTYLTENHPEFLELCN